MSAKPLRTPPEYFVTSPTRMPPMAFDTTGSHVAGVQPVKSPRSRMSAASGVQAAHVGGDAHR